MKRIRIPFNKPAMVGNELRYVQEACHNQHLSANGPFSKKCEAFLESKMGASRVLMCHSGSSALEMAATLADLKPGDEVILPSYTFVSTATAFASRGASLVFVDIHPDTMNIDETQIEKAITPKTKVIVPVHYAGVACQMDAIMEIAKKHHLLVIEDAAQAFSSTYHGKPLGTIGHLGCMSFHETKNVICGEGGALIINDKKLINRAEIICNKGTNRAQFNRGEVDRYSWKDTGSNYGLSDLGAAYLYAQFEAADDVQQFRQQAWLSYFEGLQVLEEKGLVSLPKIPEGCHSNAHLFYLKTKTPDERTALLNYLKERGIGGVFHYVPLHSSEEGKKRGRFYGKDQWTTLESEKIVRLPLWYGIKDSDIRYVIQSIYEFYKVESPIQVNEKEIISEFTFQKILVTGAAGFIGKVLTHYFAAQGKEVIAIDAQENPEGVYPSNVSYYAIKLPDPKLELILQEHRPEVCIHAAGPASVGGSFEDSLSDFQGSVNLTYHLLDTIKRVIPKMRFVFLSSAAVYGNPQALPIHEESLALPISPYGFHKVQCESICKEYQQIHGMDIAIARIFSAYGSGLKRQVIWDVCRKMMTQNSVTLQGTGNESRDFIHVHDIALALDFILKAPAIKGETYNVSSGVESTIQSVARTLKQFVQKETEIKFSGEVPKGTPLNWRADISKLMALGFRPSLGLHEGIEEAVSVWKGELSKI